MIFENSSCIFFFIFIFILRTYFFSFFWIFKHFFSVLNFLFMHAKSSSFSFSLYGGILSCFHFPFVHKNIKESYIARDCNQHITWAQNSNKYSAIFEWPPKSLFHLKCISKHRRSIRNNQFVNEYLLFSVLKMKRY